jgi:hypothetical protein
MTCENCKRLELELAKAQAANVSYYDFIRSYFVDGILRHTNGKSYRELAKELLANEPDTSALAAAVAEATKDLSDQLSDGYRMTQVAIAASQKPLLDALRPFAELANEIPNNRKQLGVLTQEDFIRAAAALAKVVKP